jgi:hypothetical protein
MDPYIDRVELGLFRSGTNALAGLDPDPTYFVNPLICSTNYAYYAELDLQNGITNSLDVGSPGGTNRWRLNWPVRRWINASRSDRIGAFGHWNMDQCRYPHQ